MFYYYKSYKAFIDEYPRFKLSRISFDCMKSQITRIKNWFASDDCIDLPRDDCCSKHFWKNITDYQAKSTAENAIDWDYTHKAKHQVTKGTLENCIPDKDFDYDEDELADLSSVKSYDEFIDVQGKIQYLILESRSVKEKTLEYIQRRAETHKRTHSAAVSVTG